MRLSGIVPPVLTPFNSDESPDEGAFRALLDMLVEKGVHGLFPLGSAGDGLLLNLEERKRLARVAVDEARGRVPVMVHTGAITTAECLELTRHAAEIGADVASVLPPYYYRYDEESVFRHIKTVADAVPGLAVYVYNNPSTTGNPVSTSLLKRLAAACPNIVGAKDSSDSLQQSQDYVQAMGPDFAVLTGSSTIVVASLATGCCGAIYSFANALPELAVSMYDAVRAGNVDAALERQNAVIALRNVMVKNGGVSSGLKAVLQGRGLAFGGARRPMRVLSAEESERVVSACRELGLLQALS